MNLDLETFLNEKQVLDELNIPSATKSRLTRLITDEYLSQFVKEIIQESEEILSIDPGKNRKEILEEAAQKIARNVGAEAATIRLFDSRSFQMISYGAFGVENYGREQAVSAKDSIAGLVVTGNKSIAVPNILEDERYQSKQITRKLGYNSLLAVPLRMPSFVGDDQDLLGSLQIYYKENNREFANLEIMRAEMLARRVSYVLAKKKIIDLYNLNKHKERIVDKIFVKLSNREAIRMKDFFNMIIPELGKFIQLQSCSLFTLSDDQKYLQLAASYPTDQTYHESGYTFTVSHHSFFWTAIHGTREHIDMPFERVNPLYVLIKNPLRSELISEGMLKFVLKHQVHSILLVPLKVQQKVRHILLFYATEHKFSFTDEEIELLTFFGKEITKASRLEFLGDMLHDFKNPAIAVAGLAARASKLLAREDLEDAGPKLKSYLDIISKEATRLQDMAQTISGEGHDDIIDLGKVALDRFRLNEEVIRVSPDMKVNLSHPYIEHGIMIRCPLFGMERVLDNLLNNATKAVALTGGSLTLRCTRRGDMACLEVENSATVGPDVIDKLQRGEAGGRGLNIIRRFVQENKGKLHMRTEDENMTVTINFPIID